MSSSSSQEQKPEDEGANKNKSFIEDELVVFIQVL